MSALAVRKRAYGYYRLAFNQDRHDPRSTHLVKLQVLGAQSLCIFRGHDERDVLTLAKVDSCEAKQLEMISDQCYKDIAKRHPRVMSSSTRSETRTRLLYIPYVVSRDYFFGFGRAKYKLQNF